MPAKKSSTIESIVKIFHEQFLEKYQWGQISPFPCKKWRPLSQGMLIFISLPHVFD